MRSPIDCFHTLEVSRSKQVAPDDLPPTILKYAERKPEVEDDGRILPLKVALEKPEREVIERALRANNWNRQLTADVLDINRTTLYKKIKKYDLEFAER